ncbi:hypothetical protein LV779_03510 [Streptomyces thinghirensis]|nr:hypothetical protein [Streptomyces thinghirensis]
MRHRIARLAGLPLLSLLALLLPGSGRRRRRPPATEPAESPYIPDVTVRRTGMPALCGEDNVLVRPLPARPRTAGGGPTGPGPAPRAPVRGAGIDLGPRVPHDVEVAR